jgi:hypothetical protein
VTNPWRLYKVLKKLVSSLCFLKFASTCGATLRATLQAKRALREALLHAPGLRRGGAALDILSGKKPGKWDDSDAPGAKAGGASALKVNPLLAVLGGGAAGGSGAAAGGGLMSRWQLAKLGAQVEVAKNKPLNFMAAVLQMKLEVGALHSCRIIQFDP